MELGINEKLETLKIFNELLHFYKNKKLIRIPYYNPTKYKEEIKYIPDDREIEEIDPIFKIKNKFIVRIRTGPPAFLSNLITPKDRKKGKSY